jgi:hypothetical protein
MEKDMSLRSIRIGSALLLAMTAGASADVVIFDQIGAGTAATNGQNVAASQDFPDFPTFNIAAIDDFTHPGGQITRVEAVMGFFNSTASSFANVTNWRVEFYTSVASAGANLTGNAGSTTVAPGAVTITGGYTSGGTNSSLVSIPVNVNLAAGTYWVGIMPVMSFGTGGQLGVAASTIAAQTASSGAQANPAGGFGFGPTQNTNVNYAYRVSIIPAPSSMALLGLGGLAVARRRRR